MSDPNWSSFTTGGNLKFAHPRCPVFGRVKLEPLTIGVTVAKL